MDDQTIRDRHPFKFTGRLQGWQNAAVYKIAQHRYGILQAPSGSGKAMVVSALLEERRYPTLILVKTIRELHLWVDHLESQGIDPLLIGRIGDRNHEVDRPLTVAIDRTYWRHLESFAPKVGQVIIPKCHAANQKIFHLGIGKTNARYVLGLSDLPRRDGLGGLMTAYCGPLLYQKDVDRGPRIGSEGGKVKAVQTDWDWQYKDDFQPMVSAMAIDYNRNTSIVSDICFELSNSDVRAIGVSDRLEHLEHVRDALSDQTINSGLITSYTHESDERRMIKAFNSGRLRMLFVSARSLSALTNTKQINRLFVMTPLAGGEILSTLLGLIDSDSIIYDYVDRPEICRASFRRRNKFYQERNFKEQL